MLSFNSVAEEEAFLDLFDLCLHSKRLDLEISENTFERILGALYLDGLANWVDQLNPSKLAPYHGAVHEKLMTCYAFMGAAYHDIDWTSMRCIVAAACLHDFDHTGVNVSSTDDTVNIDRALTGAKAIFKKSPLMFTDGEKLLVERLIACTRYPYLNEPVDLLEEIMRDADMCMPYVSAPLREKLFHGLRQELATSGRIYTIEAFADGVVTFYSTGIQHTEWAKCLAIKHNLESTAQDLGSNLRMSSANY